jgi:transcriptional regulator with XRE-family HTH domain
MTERNTPKLLDRAREMCSPQTDYQLAKDLGITRMRLSHYRSRGSAPDNEVAWKLAKKLGLPITDVIAYFEADRAKDPQKRAFWAAQLPRVLSTFAIAATLYSSVDRGALNVEGSTVTGSVAFNRLYIMRSTILA